MKEIELSKGYVALVDDDDYEWLMQWSWHFAKGYAVRNGKNRGDKQIYMHREVLKVPVGEFTDHIDGNKLDNRKSNLRRCTYSQNNRNKKLTKANTSGRKGVSWNKARQQWHASIWVRPKKIFLGLYDDLDAAGKAYEDAANFYFGEFANNGQMPSKPNNTP
jgi:AP2 domain.